MTEHLSGSRKTMYFKAEALLEDSVSLKEINHIRILSSIYSAVFCNEAVMKMYLKSAQI